MRTRNIPSRIRTVGRLARALRRRPLQRKPRITSLNLGGDKRLIAFKDRPVCSIPSVAKGYDWFVRRYTVDGVFCDIGMTVCELAEMMNEQVPAFRAEVESIAARA